MDRKRGRKADIKERKMSPAGVVQWTEYWPVNSTVACSIPSQSTKKEKFKKKRKEERKEEATVRKKKIQRKGRERKETKGTNEW